MRSLGFIFATTLTVTQPLLGLLPPLYESKKEMLAILESPELLSKLSSGELIIAIEKNESGYEVRTNKSHLQVDVQYQEAEHPGPAQFELEFHSVEHD